MEKSKKKSVFRRPFTDEEKKIPMKKNDIQPIH